MDTTTDSPPTRHYNTLAEYMADLTPEQREAYRQEVIARLGFDPDKERSRGIGIAEASRLAGVLVGTGTQWRRRTKTGRGLTKPFPAPKPNSPRGKPLYNPYNVCAWLEWTLRWPPGTAARPDARTSNAGASV